MHPNRISSGAVCCCCRHAYAFHFSQGMEVSDKETQVLISYILRKTVLLISFSDN